MNEINKFLVPLVAFLVFFALTDKNHKSANPFHKLSPKAPELIEEKKSYTFDDALKSISKDSLETNLKFFASDELEGRMSGKKGNELAAVYLENKLKEYGYQPAFSGSYFQKFDIRRTNPGPKNEIGNNYTSNIVGYLEGNELKDEIILIGAHMDHVGYGPDMSLYGGGKIHYGADDNASGTTAVLEVAKALSLLKGKLKRTIVVAFFSAEEMGLIGSKYFVDHSPFPIRNYSFMINLDMVGYSRDNQLSFLGGSRDRDMNDLIIKVSKNHSINPQITSTPGGGSDHVPFYNKKIPVVFLHTGMHPNYHRPSDTYDKINFTGLTQISRLTFELLWGIQGLPQRPKFTVLGEFEPLEYKCDHGQCATNVHPDHEVQYVQPRRVIFSNKRFTKTCKTCR